MSTRSAIIISLLIGSLAWGALAALIMLAGPHPSYVALALALTAIALAATSIPMWLRLQQRIAPHIGKRDLLAAATREGIWTGLFVAALLVLRVFRFLDWVLALVLLVLFAMLEVFLQQRRQEASAKSAPIKPLTIKTTSAARAPTIKPSLPTQGRRPGRAPFARTKPDAAAGKNTSRPGVKKHKG